MKVLRAVLAAVMAAVLAAVLATASAHAIAQERVLDDFEDPSAWTLIASDDVKASLRSEPGTAGRALCLDFDFGKVTGYAVARRELPIEFPPRYAFTLDVRGTTAPNALQVKLVDASGENVWWAQRPEFRFPVDWQTLKLRQRQIEFAWGPTPDRVLRRSQAVELVVASGSGAGQGSACFDRLALQELPAEATWDKPAAALASSALPGHAAGQALDGGVGTAWQARPDDPQPTLTIDHGQPREFSELVLRWRPGATPARYAVEVSDDAAQWRTLRRVERARGAVQRHWLPETEARFVRLVLADAGAALAEIEFADAASANAHFMQLAKDAPRGLYPRAFHAEQAYWTVFGVDGGRTASLLGEDGAVEPIPGVGALEPFLVEGGRLVNWADAGITHSLRDGDLPMPAVHWRAGNLRLDIAAFAHGTPQAAQAIARYTVRNLGRRTRSVTLALAWRPFQVNPPTQFLAHPGGASTIETLAWDGRALAVNGAVRLHALVAPSSVRLEPSAAGPVGEWLHTGGAALGRLQITDPAGFASAVLRYELRLRPGEQREIAVALPVTGARGVPKLADIAGLETRAAAQWRERLRRVRLTGPGPVADMAATLRAALGHILVNRSGAAIQPGARAYARSWIRDGSLTSAALLRLGHADVARDFLLWYAPFQFKNGKVPCCATVRGADPVPENDSDGQFVFAAADLWRYTADAATARRLWPNVRAAVEHMEALRASERTPANRSPERRAYFGLMPPSISHEGYSDKPAYSYWDNFWAATGYRAAVELAQGLGLPQEARRIAALGDEFRADLLASIDASTAIHKLDVLPGAADRGDVDPTSSTVALSPGGLLGTLPDTLLRNTFERYWRDFVARRDSGRPWDAYTPYEWRNVGALVRLGERERALAAMDFFYRHRRPAGWKQWAEVVLRDPREPRFLGDMPHGWVASDHIRAVLDLFAYEDEARRGLVLAAGVPMAWFDGPGLALDGLHTPWGQLGWRARATPRGAGKTIVFELRGLRDMPRGGIVLRGPWPKDSRVRVDGRAVPGAADAIRLTGSPTRVRIDLP